MVELYSIKMPRNFFEEEIRYNYHISKKRKEVWAVELDLLKKFDELCNNYNLKYYADAGTLLGAIRHSGFIPWDDDIDVVMPRKDYQVLCEISNNCFQFPYFFQTEYTDPGSVRGHAQLRNSETTAFLKHEYEKKCGFNQGIFIDIFPLDNIPPAKDREKFWCVLKMLYDKSLVYANKNENNIKYFNYDYYEFERFVQKYNVIPELKLFGNISFYFDNPIGYRRIIDYKSWEYMPFENTKIRVPCGYKNILRICYGIWREIIMANSIHGKIYFDTNKSYMEYLKDDGMVSEDMLL